jgi:hypothetical protein
VNSVVLCRSPRGASFSPEAGIVGRPRLRVGRDRSSDITRRNLRVSLCGETAGPVVAEDIRPPELLTSDMVERET